MLSDRTARDYPSNLLDEIAGGEWDCELPTDINGTIEYVMRTFLTERMADVLRKRFRNHMSLDELGRELGITRERVRQIERKGIRYLRMPQNLMYLQLGVKGVIKCSENKALGEKLDKALEFLEKISGFEKIQIEVDPRNDPGAIPIENLMLSTRTFNCLKRAGVNTLSDLTEYTEERLMRVRNFGARCRKEVLLVLAQHGLKLKEETET